MKYKSEKEQTVLESLIKENLVPFGLFDISELHIDSYLKVYGEFYGSGNYGTNNNKKYARRLAGLSLLRLKFSRGGNTTNCKEGIVYTIANQAWPNHLKIGITCDLDKRINSYQTCDPFRQFKVKHYEFVLDRKSTERKILNKYNVNIETGEWLNSVNANDIMKEF